MTNSTIIARLMGPVLLSMGIGAVIGLLGKFPEAYLDVLREMNNQSATIILGMFALLAGLAIVNAHNLWVSDWRAIITILGWLAIVRGALSLLFPNKMYGIGDAILASRSGPMIGAAIVIVLGGILSWMGYRRSKSEVHGPAL
jgi:vacuolar-type H+-ATPase subunit I/STV1